VAGVLSLLLFFGMLGGAYALARVPLPADEGRAQVSTLYYSDGKTVLARLGTENRTDVRLAQVPKHVQQAMIAAEDRSFYTNSGISPRGIARAFWANLRGEEVQGGSTITQQYVKNAHLDQERTFTRKTREIVWAIKADRTYSKDEILEFYLNTIYFGRGAWGIEAAAQVYFGVPASGLSLEQGAVLAGVIKAPSYYDPRNNPQRAKERWRYVLDGMVSLGWLDAGRAASTPFPPTRPISAGNGANTGLKGDTGVIVGQVERELLARGFTDQEIRTGGLKIVTTVNKRVQDTARAALRKVFAEQPKNLAKALVAVEPGTGRVKAYYGGESGYKTFDLAAASHPAGSSFKAYVLAEALSQGISVRSYWDGSSPQTFPDRPNEPVNNSEDRSCRRCDLTRATVLSLNTTYYALTSKVGAAKVAQRAEASGIRTLDGKPVGEMIEQRKIDNSRIALGEVGISVLDQAAGYATFAAKGVHATPTFLERVEQDGAERYDLRRVKPVTRRAFSADVAADATYALEQVVRAGKRLEDGRRAAGKTGTAQFGDDGRNGHAWMAGYTPQLATAIWVGRAGDDGPIQTASGRDIYGSGLPTQTWRTFMNGALAGAEELGFPEPVFGGDMDSGTESSPEPEREPEPEPEPERQQPSREPSLAPSPSPSVSADGSPRPRPSRSRTRFPTPSFSIPKPPVQPDAAPQPPPR